MERQNQATSIPVFGFNNPMMIMTLMIMNPGVLMIMNPRVLDKRTHVLVKNLSGVGN